jgi:hypothetical protein
MKLGRSSQPALALLGVGLLLCGTYAWAQNLGSASQTNVAVQGQTRRLTGRCVSELHQLGGQSREAGRR